MTRPLWKTAALLALCACASTPKSPGPAAGAAGLAEAQGGVLVEASGRQTSANITGNTLSGPQLSVQMDAEAARGEAWGAPLDLLLKPDGVLGKAGSGETQLQLQPKTGGLRAEGVFSGQPTSFEISSNTLSGSFAACSYDLKRSNRASTLGNTGVGGSGAGTEYRGERTCPGSELTSVKVTLPPGFERLGLAHQATILELMLGR